MEKRPTSGVGQMKFQLESAKSGSSVAKMFGEINDLRNQETEDELDRYAETWCGRLAGSRRFEVLCLGVIVLNALAIGLDTELDARRLTLDALPMLEQGFTVFFILELVARLAGHRSKLQCISDRWFLFDTVLVILMVLENWILSAGNNLSVLRLMRLLRISRMARIMRAVPELMIILKGLIAAMRTVACTGLLMGLVLYVWSIFFTSSFHQGWSTDESFSPCHLQWYFGSIGKSMFTLFVMGTLLDDITPCIWVLRKHSWMMAAMMVVFILVSSFNILNTLVGVLVEVVCATEAGETAKMRDAKVTEDIKAIFQQMDADNSGYISRANFYEMRHHEQVISVLDELGIDEEHFDLLGELLFRRGEESEDVELRELSFPRLLAMMTMLRPGTAANALEFALFRRKVTEALKGVKNSLLSIQALLAQPQPRLRRGASGSTFFSRDPRSPQLSRQSSMRSELSHLMSQFDERLVVALIDAIAALRRESSGEAVAMLLETFAELERTQLPNIVKELQTREGTLAEVGELSWPLKMRL